MTDNVSTTSFSRDIQPLFSEIDVDHMRWFCDLRDYGDVKSHAPQILGRLKGESGPVMPPQDDGGPWSQCNIDLFEKWISEGCPA